MAAYAHDESVTVRARTGLAMAGDRRRGPRREQEIGATILSLIEEQHQERVTLRHIGDALRLSPFQVLRVFQRCYGVTPHCYLVELRVRRASELLLDGEPIAEVAADVGFVDQSHMTRHFKRQLGLTPYQFLKSRPRGAGPHHRSKRRRGAISGDAASARPLGATDAQA